jgi:hypothetical protein
MVRSLALEGAWRRAKEIGREESSAPVEPEPKSKIQYFLSKNTRLALCIPFPFFYSVK